MSFASNNQQITNKQQKTATTKQQKKIKNKNKIIKIIKICERIYQQVNSNVSSENICMTKKKRNTKWEG